MPIGTTVWSRLDGVLVCPRAACGFTPGGLVFIPIGDDNTRRERIPFVNLGLIALNAFVFIAELGAHSRGVLAAYVLYCPRNRVLVWFFFQVFAVPALLVIGLWALLQFISGAGSLIPPAEGGGTAYVAHVGGFACGFLLALVFRPRAAAGK